MAIIIDANMPTKGCADCPLKRYWEGNPWTYGYACFITSRDIDKEIKEGVFHESCPIIGEIPDSHGELKDVSILLHYLAHMHGATEHDNDLLREFEKMIRECPTVVEATE